MKKGNLFGFVAIILWSTLGSLSVLSSNIPPFELVFMAFFVAFIIGAFLWKKDSKGIMVHLKWPFKVWFIGVFGLFGYHYFYFLAMQNAPALEANLINYLWPLFIVLFSSFLPNEKLRWFHVLGVLFGFVGVFLLISKDENLSFNPKYIDGYLYAFVCACIWGVYSVVSRYFAQIPTSAVGGFCAVSSILALICHLIFEVTYIPDFKELFVVLLIGLGPVGGAFFVWDYGVKNGDIQFLGTLSYFTPLLSTALLIFLGLANPTNSVWIACFFIILGSIISSLPQFKKLYCKIMKRRKI